MTNKFLLAICMLCCSPVFCQTLKYDITLFGKKIGEAKVERKDSAGFVKYSIESHSDAHILGMDKKDAMACDAVFQNDKMITSSYRDEKKGRKEDAHAEWDKGKLDIDVNDKKSSLGEAVSNSSLTLYFVEPKNNEKIFSERLGQFVEIAKEKEGKYKIAFNDYTAIYTYVEGKIKELQMKEDAGQVVMRLVE